MSRVGGTRTMYKSIAALLGTAALCLPTFAGNIALTGHDDDFHQSTNALGQIKAFATFATNGSSLPILVFDAGSELTGGLTAAGVTNFVNVDPNTPGAVTDALFSHSTYSAFMIASDTTCGGCDNDTTSSAAIAAHAKAIANFLNAGGGIVAFAGANNTDYYSFLPQTASSVGGAPSSGYSQTSVGASLGIPAVNGDATHNLFWNPGTHGTSSAYQVAEVNSIGNGTILGPDAATTLVCKACTTSGGVIIGPGGPGSSVPEPSTFVLLGAGLAALAFFARRKRAAHQS